MTSRQRLTQPKHPESGSTVEVLNEASHQGGGHAQQCHLSGTSFIRSAGTARPSGLIARTSLMNDLTDVTKCAGTILARAVNR